MPRERVGLLYGVAAYLMWGLFPLYWPLLEPAGAPEILAHRIVWTLLVVLAILAVTRAWTLGDLDRRRAGWLALAAVLIANNWLIYIYGVNSGQVVETSLGYFTNPLVTIALGVLVLRERLRPAQWAAVGLGAAAVTVLTLDYGRPPWIALSLAVSFAAYGLIKKHVGIGGVDSLTVETAVLVLPAALALVLLGARGDATFGTAGPGHALLLVSTGVATAIPLICFGAAAIRVPLSTIGLLQYLAPVLQFLIGVVVYREPMPASRVAGFALVWLALLVLTADGLLHHRRTPRAAAASLT